MWQIVREAIVNAERHSNGTTIEVVGDETPFTVIISVLDDGVGIDATSPRPDSYGLIGMAERAGRVLTDDEVDLLLERGLLDTGESRLGNRHRRQGHALVIVLD